jgi:secreted PhoX family phosphatase
MAKDFSTMEDSNRSSNTDIHFVSQPGRRILLKGAIAASLSGLLAGCAATGMRRGTLSFKPIPAAGTDTLVVPEGYLAEAFAAWGEPVGIAGAMPAFKEDASNSAADQEVQMGMHHDGIHYFPLDGSRRGLLVMNHEYTDDGLLHPDGMKTWTPDKVKKAQAAHGISVTEIEQKDGRWQMVRPSRYARRFTANTPFAIGGPAAGHRLMQTAADPWQRTLDSDGPWRRAR